MIRIKKSRKSKCVVLVDWALQLYCDTLSDVRELIHIYGPEKVTVKPIGG
jgi:hypothetical protein